MADQDGLSTMQRTCYDTLGKEKPEIVVGRYGFNENVPYERHLTPGTLIFRARHRARHCAKRRPSA